MARAASTSKRAEPPPISLAHYTTLAGLMGIVESGQLWFSNVSFLNDHRELQHGVDASLEALPLLSTKAAAANWRSAFESAERALKAGNIPDTYAACFCRDKDLLSQWRGYGGAEQGVAVVFSRSKLQEALKESRAALYRVIYCDVTARSKMRRALEEALGDLNAYDEIADLFGDTEAERNREALRAVCRLLPQFKHLGFREEREWRFVVQMDSAPDNLQFRVRGSVLVPYLKLGPGGPGSLPITRLVVGPGKNQEVTERSLRLLLAQHGYSTVRVESSRVPFRS